MKRSLAVILAALMVIVSVGIMPQDVSAAVKAPAMTKKTVSVKTGKRASVSLKSASINNGWTISKATVVNKRFASVGNTSTKITITGKKVGNTSVKVVAVNGASTKNLSVKVKVSKATIPVQSVKVDSNVDIKVGESKYLIATVDPSNATNKTISWESNNTSVVTVDGNGQIRGLAVGTAKVTATSNNGWYATCLVTVKPADVPATDIKLDVTSKSIYAGESFTLKAILTPANSNSTVTWSTSDPYYVAVDSTGKVTGVRVGLATITATANGKSVTCRVYVNAKVDATSITLQYGNKEYSRDNELVIEVTPGSVVDLTAKLTPAGTTSTVTWESTDKSYVEPLTTTGLVTKIYCKKETPTNTPITITARTENGKYIKCLVKVRRDEPATDIKISRSTVTIEEKETLQLTAIITPATSTSKITWASSSPTYVSVDSNGIITGLKACSNISVTAKTDNGRTAYCYVTVLAPKVTTTIAVSETTKTIKVDDTFKLTAAVTPVAPVTWSSSNTSVATVDASGNVVGKAAGFAAIIATANGENAYCYVTVEPKVVEPVDVKATGIKLSCSIGGPSTKNQDFVDVTLDISKDDSLVLWADVEPADTTSKVEWVVDDNAPVEKEIVTVDGKSIKITGKSNGVAVIRAKIDGYEAICRINITGAAQ